MNIPLFFPDHQCANIGPADYNYDETISTLRYANRAKNIKNKARINEDPKDALLRQFQKEIEDLKKKLEEGKPRTAATESLLTTWVCDVCLLHDVLLSLRLWDVVYSRIILTFAASLTLCPFFFLSLLLENVFAKVDTKSWITSSQYLKLKSYVHLRGSYYLLKVNMMYMELS